MMMKPIKTLYIIVSVAVFDGLKRMNDDEDDDDDDQG
jgi:hypothetical protein